MEERERRRACGRGHSGLIRNAVGQSITDRQTDTSLQSGWEAEMSYLLR